MTGKCGHPWTAACGNCGCADERPREVALTLPLALAITLDDFLFRLAPGTKADERNAIREALDEAIGRAA